MLCLGLLSVAQVRFTDATALTIINKLGPTERPYSRVDTHSYDLTEAEDLRLNFPAGMAVVFKTNSTFIDIRTDYADYRTNNNMPRITTAGYDLYIKRDGEWIYANSSVAAEGKDLHLIANMDSQEKECLLYLPLWSVLNSVKIGVDEKASISAGANPFRHRILIIGSSYTHGDGASRSGMSYPMQLERATGLQFISLGISGQAKMQPALAQIVCDNSCDALVLDVFSNPSPEQIRERLFPFITKIRQSHPDMPIIFLRTIHRERSNFDLKTRENEQSKIDASEEMMKLAVKQFNDVYFIDTANQTGTDHATSIDGVHPGDMGYMRWAETIRPQIVKILKRHGIK